MLDGLATSFERKFLFGFGRHFWNVDGVARVVAIAVGGATLITSREKPVLPYTDWLKQEKREYRSYSRPLETHNAKTIVSRSLSPLVIGWGLGSIASVSVISSVLAVERNSRKE